MKKLLSRLLPAVLIICLCSCSAPSAVSEEPSYYEKLLKAVDSIREKTDFTPDIALVLGSGLGDFADNIDVVCEINYEDIEGFPAATAPNHEGSLILGTCGGKKLAVMKGRIHYYEGYDMKDVVFPLRTIGLLGAKTVILTNAAGAMNPDYSVGDFVVIKDHISSFVPSPLIGENISQLGDRFTDMTNVYDEDLRNLVLSIGDELDTTVRSGVYLQVTGPQFETPAEIKMYRNAGGDMIGMSTAVEAIAARHMGLKVVGISCISNMAAGMTEGTLSHEDISSAAGNSSKDFTRLITTLLERMDN